jgi:GNAT superfamily N-acetyltransferase
MGNRVSMVYKTRDICSVDYRWLYGFLKCRDPKINISHQRVPSWTAHCRYWRDLAPAMFKTKKIILICSERIGYYYITKNDEIGIFIAPKYHRLGIGRDIVKKELAKNGRIYANVAPGNYRSQCFFKKMGFKIIQFTYLHKNR